jgi:hypothetical protein
VIRIRRSFDAPELAARVDSHLALGHHHRLVAGAVAGDMVFDAQIMPREPYSPRTYLYAVLAGALFLRAPRRRIPAGHVVVAPNRRAFFEAAGAHHCGAFRILAVQVDSVVLPAPLRLGVLPLDTRMRDAAEALHADISRGAPGHAFEGTHRTWLLGLQALGLPFSPAHLDAAASPPSARVRELAEALSDALSLSGTRPALQDLTGGALSERTARRLLPLVAQEYGFSYAGWRALRRTFSAALACLALTVPRATPSLVARLVGFAGAASLCHALRDLGLPAPRQLQRAAARIRGEHRP